MTYRLTAAQEQELRLSAIRRVAFEAGSAPGSWLRVGRELALSAEHLLLVPSPHQRKKLRALFPDPIVFDRRLHGILPYAL